MNIKKIFNLIMAIVFAFSLLGTPVPVSAQEYSPNIGVTTSRLQIIGSGWPIGSEIILSIDGVANGAGVDYTEKTTMQPSSWDPDTIVANFDLNGKFTFYPGDVITMTDGIVPMTYTVQAVTLMNIDVQADTASGTGTPGHQLLICVSWIDFCAVRRYVTVDSSGDWIVDFSQPGPDGQEIVDILPGYNVRVIDQDEYGNLTCEFWDVHFPDMEVNTNTPQRAGGSGWLIGSEITLSIDSASNGVGIDYTEKTTMQPAQGALFQLDQKFTLHPGDIITMTDGVTPINYIVQELELTNIDVQTGVVSGTGTPGDQLLICVSRTNFCAVRRYVTVDSSGDWIADFSQPGPEGQETIILQPGDEVRPIDQDENGNRTVQLWTVPTPPYFTIRENYDQVEAYQWDMENTLTVTIDDPATADNPDYTASQTVTGTAPWDSSQTYLPLYLSGIYDIQTGDTVSVSNGTITKTTVVSNLAITNVHLDTDMVDGTVGPNQIISVWTCWQSDPCISRDETANQNGNWIANFAVPGEQDWEQATADLRPGSWIDSSIGDEDGDSTMFGWYVDIPNIEANTGNDSVVARGWPNGTPLTLTIDDPSNGPGVDQTMYATLGPSSWDPNDIAANFNLPDFDLQPGHILKVTDGTTEATYVPTKLTVTGINLDADTISGIALPGVEVEVWVGVSGPHVLRYVTSDAVTGYWTADYGHFGQRDDEQQLVDLRSGIEGFVKEFDANRNATHTDWRVPDNQPPVADAGGPYSGYTSLSIIIDASTSSDLDGDVLTYAWDFDNDGQYDASGITTTTSFNQTGEHTIVLQVTDSGGLSNTDTATVTVLPWTLKGFYQPVDMNGIYNIVKGGSTVPLKFEIFAGSTELTDVAYIKSLTYTQTSCDANAITDEIETTATGSTSLRYADGQFIYNWKTPKNAGKCYRVTMTTIDNSSLVAYFKLK